MKHVSIRFLIGLGDPNKVRAILEGTLIQRQTDRRAKAHDILTRAYEVGSFFYGAGVWQGQGEPSMMFETVEEDSPAGRDRARAIAYALKVQLDQDAVGLVFTPVDFELV